MLKRDGKLKVVIIGAGAGGTGTAARLAHAGYDVHVYEKNDFHGGRCSLIHKNGFRFDQGPSLYLMPKIFEQTFTELGEDIKDHLELVQCDPNYYLYFDDGSKMELSSDLAKMKQEIEKIEPGSYGSFLQFLKEGQVHYDISEDMVLTKNFEKWSDFFNPKNAPALFHLHIHDTLYSRISKFFKTDKLRRAFTFQSMYMGMSPYDAPATYSLLQYTEFAEGIWYPKGGFNKVIERLEHLAKKRGAKFHYGKGVSKINIAEPTGSHDVNAKENYRHTTGVTLDDGTVVNADIVVCNADLVYAYNNLLPPNNYAKRLQNKDQTSSSFSFYWGMKRKIPELDGHNIFLAADYRESFDQIFQDYTLPAEPSFYIHCPSRLDEAAAPAGKEAITVLIPTGCINPEKPQDYEALRQRARKQVISIIEQRTGIKNFESLIECEVFNTPQIWTQKFNIFNGAILGLSHTVPQVCWMRPSTRHGEFNNLFFVGASTHPGTGVPIVLYGARLVTDQINKNVKDKTLYKGDKGNSMSILIALLVAIIAIWYAVNNPEAVENTIEMLRSVVAQPN
ncbi:phytoene dehydrogenase-like protein [Paraphysoderma sedebokerense]|nr:phytoene dehydrogenase-like protein [Paraphysoderma sedebokerense]